MSLAQKIAPVTAALAERHEALWLSLCALHKDITALGVKKPNAPTTQAVRIAAEALLSDCAPFIPAFAPRAIMAPSAA
ncbi:MAG: hypothetical protein ACOH2N_06225 [Devosia sp.]